MATPEYRGSARFKAGQLAVWPNGTVSEIVAVDDEDDTICRREDGAWFDAWDCDLAESVSA